MKKILLISLLLLGGCTAEQVGAFLGGMGQGFNNAAALDASIQASQPSQVIYPQPDYWQERRAKQEYLDNAFSFPAH